MFKIKLPTQFITKAAVFVFISVMLLSLSLYAQEGNNDRMREILKEKYGDNAEEILKNPGLGHYLDAEEILKPLPEKGEGSKEPPSGSVSPVAEFDPAEAVLIRYPFGIPYSLIADLSNHTKVITLVSSTSQQSTVESLYSSNGVNLANCEFAIYSTDSYWTRDYGPWFIRDGEDDIAIVDFPYNRPRPNDNNIPSSMASYLSMPYYYMPVYHTGGNYMNDGYYIAASSDLVYEENSGLSQAQVNQYMNNYLGASTYHAVPDPNNTYIDHIDCWGKFLAPNKILIRSVPTSHAQYDEIEATADYFANQVSAYGTKYKVYRVYTPSDQPYTNSLILNDKVFVPITGSATYDNAALAVYQDAMPGYTVEGYTGSWESTDALHCRTHEIADRGMLYIKHYPLMPYQPASSGFNITAEIIPYSGSALISNELKVYYQAEGSSKYSYVLLSHISGNTYGATIPSNSQTQVMNYYITAGDASGRTENHPYIGAPDPHVFMAVDPDIVSPESPLDLESNISSGLDELSWYYDDEIIDIEGFQILISTSPEFGAGTYTDYMAYAPSIDDIYQYDASGYTFNAGSTYYWKINLVTWDMEIDFTPSWSFTVSSYPAPVSLTASSAYSDRIELGWNAPGTMPKAVSVSGYNIYRSSQLEGTYTKINSSAVINEFYTDYGVSCPEVWYYGVTAVYSDSTESAMSEKAQGMTVQSGYYSVSLSADPAGGAELFYGEGLYEEGDPVSIGADVSAGYNFLYWTGTYSYLLDDIYSVSASFSMPADNVELTAVFEELERIDAVISLGNTAFKGIWRWSYTEGKGSSWVNLMSGQTASKIIAGDITGDELLEAVVNFESYGLWYYSLSTSSWVNLMSGTVPCADFTLADMGPGSLLKLVGSFQGCGLYDWDPAGSSWNMIIGQTASIISAGDISRDGIDELALSFSGINGMYIYDFSLESFSKILTVSPSQLKAGDITGDGYTEIACVFETFGTFMLRYIPGKHEQSIDRAYRSFDLESDIPSCHEWFSKGIKGLQFFRMTYGTPDPGHYLGTGDIANGPGHEVIITYLGKAYSYSYDTLSWAMLIGAPLDRVISGKFTGSLRDDLIVSDSSTANLYLKNEAEGGWELILQDAQSQALAPLD